VLLLLVSCIRLSTDLNDEIIAKVNGEPVFLNEFTISFDQLRAKRDGISQKNPKLVAQLKTRALNEVIVMKILRQEAAKNEVRIAKEEVEGRLANWKDGYPVGGFEEMLRKRNTSEDFLKRKIEQLLLIEKLTNELFSLETLVSDEELKKYYKKNKKEFRRSAQVHAFQIVVPTVNEAKKIRQEILSNTITFQSAARQYSLSPDAAKGGDLGFFSRNEKIPAFNKAFSLTVGVVSQPIKSDYGVHLLRVVEKRMAKSLGFQQAKPEIVNRLRRRKEIKVYKEWISNLLKEGKIYRNDSLFKTIT